MHKHLATSLSILLLVACGAYANETQGESNQDTLPLWELKFATFARYGQSYPASEESQFDFVPLPFPIYRGPILRVGDESGKPVSTRVFATRRLKLDFDFGLNFAVDSDDIDARVGMPDLHLLLEAGPELEILLADSLAQGKLTLALQARGAWSFDGFDTTSRGAVVSTELKYIKPLKEIDSEFRIRIQPEWANDDYMDFFYGVAPQFETSFRPAYAARSGYLGTRVSASVKKQLSDSLEFRTGVSMGIYSGAENEQSPLFTDKSTFSGFVGLLWRFWESESREPVADKGLF